LDSSRGICSKPPEHDADHGDADEGDDSCGVASLRAPRAIAAKAGAASELPKGRRGGASMDPATLATAAPTILLRFAKDAGKELVKTVTD
jgi:hypothetical protein